jgi:putative addiction module component (TIGR02574 family)
MTPRVARLTEEARQLSIAERTELLDELLCDLAASSPDLETAWADESADRLAAYDRGEISGVTLAEFLARRKG